VNRRTFLKRAAGVAGAASAGGAAGCRRGRRLNVFNWENYVAPTTIPDFEQEFSCKVRYSTYGSAEEMLARVMAGNSGWDVVFPSNSFVGPMRELDLLEPLDERRVTLLGNLEGHFRAPEWDPGLEWCVPYMYSATGVLFSSKVARPVKGWADLWTDSYSRRVTMLDDPAEVFGACLKLLGKSVNATDGRELKGARDLAIRQKPLLRAYLNEEVRDQVVAGDVLVAQMWAQVAQVAIDANADLAFTFPAEGFALYADNCAVLRESRHKDLAWEFLNYLLRPKVAHDIAVAMRTATVNGAARQLLPESVRANPVLYPEDETLKRGEWFRALPGETQKLRDTYWTEIKSA
jgi:spermidine/putrescine transport system substrate-binding protein